MTETEVRDDVADLIHLDGEIKSMETDLKALKDSRNKLEARIAEEWKRIGKTNESRNGMTLYRSRELRASAKGGMGDQLREFLGENGMEDFIREQVSTTSLKAWIKENAPLDEETGLRDLTDVPSELLECLSLYEFDSIRVRRA